MVVCILWYISWTLSGDIATVMKYNTPSGSLSDSYYNHYNIDNTGLVNRSVTKTNLQFICKTLRAYISYGWLNSFLQGRSDIVVSIYWKHIYGISRRYRLSYTIQHIRSPELYLVASGNLMLSTW